MGALPNCSLKMKDHDDMLWDMMDWMLTVALPRVFECCQVRHAADFLSHLRVRGNVNAGNDLDRVHRRILAWTLRGQVNRRLIPEMHNTPVPGNNTALRIIHRMMTHVYAAAAATSELIDLRKFVTVISICKLARNELKASAQLLSQLDEDIQIMMPPRLHVLLLPRSKRSKSAEW
jgi:hypothetical protein